MKKYRLIGGSYAFHVKSEIYLEDYQHPWSVYSIKELVERNPDHWELIEDDFVLPEKWKVRPSNEEEDNILVNWRGGGHIGKIGKSYMTSDRCWYAIDADYIDKFVEITFEEFKTHVLNMKEEKEIIGYKAPFDMYGRNIKQGDILKLKSNCISAWYVNSSKNEIFNIPEEVVTKWEPVYKEIISQIEINGYKGEFFDDYVKFGCAQIDKAIFTRLFIDLKVGDNNPFPFGNKEIESITIGRGTFSKEQIKEIAEYFLNKDK